MNIVFLSHDGRCNGGAQMCLVDLIQGIKHHLPTAHLYLVAPDEGSLIERCTPYIDGYRIIPMKWWMFRRRRHSLIKRIRTTLSLNKSQQELRAYLQQIKPDWALTNTIVVPQLARVAHQLGIPHLWFIHEIPMLSWKEKQFMYSDQKTIDTVARLSVKVLVTSEYTHRYYATHFGCPNLATIDQAVTIKPSREPVECAVHPYTVVMVGAFEPNKGQFELLEAIRQITERGGDIYGYFVGGSKDETYMDQCRTYIEQHRLGNHIQIVPFTLDVSHYYNKADVLVNCSSMESFGRVAVEGQLCGLPVILSDVGTNPERVIDGVNGYVYEKGNVAALVDRIELLRDPARRTSFSEQLGLLHLEQYSVEAFGQRFIELIRS